MMQCKDTSTYARTRLSQKRQDEKGYLRHKTLHSRMTSEYIDVLFHISALHCSNGILIKAAPVAIIFICNTRSTFLCTHYNTTPATLIMDHPKHQALPESPLKKAKSFIAYSSSSPSSSSIDLSSMSMNMAAATDLLVTSLKLKRLMQILSTMVSFR